MKRKNESRNLWALNCSQDWRDKLRGIGKLKMHTQTNGIKVDVSLYKVAIPTNLIIFI